MKLFKKHIHSLLEMCTKNNLNPKPILEMQDEVLERDKESCVKCKFYRKDTDNCDRCCNNFDSFFTPRMNK